MPKILIVEDDLMTADMAEEVLVEHGYDVCGIARTVADAIALARRHKPDLVLLDQRLADGGLGTEVAVDLDLPGGPGILYASGNVSHIMTNAGSGHACLAKPYTSADLVRSLEIVAEILATGKATPPFPHGLRLLPPASAAPKRFSYA
jgi:DNA-binding response OmpR family regulator